EMTAHGMGDLQTVSALALNAGIDMDMVGEGFLTTLKKSLAEGKVTLDQINRSCRLILEAKYKLGLFADPYKYCNEQRAKSELYTPANLEVARQAAAQSFVLLKNDNNLLPLDPKKKIALIGPLADNKENMLGTWAVAANYTKPASLLQGLKSFLGSTGTLIYAKGSNIFGDSVMESRVSVFGKPFNWDRRPEEEQIKEALEAANKADVIVAALGELAEMSGESSSRSNISLPDAQQKLLKALLETGKPVVLVLFTGRPLAIKWEQEHVPAILNVWHGGSEAANAIADVLFGKNVPGGKLTMTWPQNVGQVPLYYAHKSTGRPLGEGKWFEKFRSNYLDVSNDPLYPFGYGLSYTTFSYGNIVLNKSTIRKTETLEVSIDVTNTGNFDASEIVQLYIRDTEGSVTRPVKELKGFQKIYLKKGESQTVRFALKNKDLGFYNSDLNFVTEPGAFKVFVGGSSVDTKEADFTVTN
ncbi:MAG TPA: glycoside hydrolase family 3 C-terminal domain-containing protein, partial [Bacteroidales bacterium]|nr:glycoside hydrolase family 3 C-terminal domain-containing protein [Bacteroidales bacterium]